jgi:hypothetical protein
MWSASAEERSMKQNAKDGRQLETISILTAESASETICFDITSFFGRPEDRVL